MESLQTIPPEHVYMCRKSVVQQRMRPWCLPVRDSSRAQDAGNECGKSGRSEVPGQYPECHYVSAVTHVGSRLTDEELMDAFRVGREVVWYVGDELGKR